MGVGESNNLWGVVMGLAFIILKSWIWGNICIIGDYVNRAIGILNISSILKMDFLSCYQGFFEPTFPIRRVYILS